MPNAILICAERQFCLVGVVDNIYDSFTIALGLFTPVFYPGSA